MFTFTAVIVLCARKYENTLEPVSAGYIQYFMDVFNSDENIKCVEYFGISLYL